MIFTETPIGGAFVIDVERREDERGFFARTFCEDEFRVHGLEAQIAQSSISYNVHRGTLRGMHYQQAPHEETKLVRCTAGALFDVIVDIRPQSPTRGRWFGAELSADNRRMMYVPRGVAHGFLTLVEATEVVYSISVPFVGEAAAGVRWNDAAFGIVWPFEPVVMNDRDRHYADWERR